MRNYNEKDIRFYKQDPMNDINIEGDFIEGEPDEEGLVDFALTEDYESARQDITNRVRTQTGNWRSHPRIGGDLELLEGEPNTRETAAQGTAQILETLTYDGRFAREDLHVRPVPTSIYEVEYYMMLDNNDEEDPIIVVQPLEL